MSIFLEVVYMFSEISIKHIDAILFRIGGGNLAIYIEQQKVINHQSNPKEKEHSSRSHNTSAAL